MRFLQSLFCSATLALLSSPAAAQQPPSPVPPVSAPPSAPPQPLPPPYGAQLPPTYLPPGALPQGAYPPPYAPYPTPMVAYPPPSRHMVRHSTALMAGGIVLTSLGGISAFAGISMFIEDAGHNYHGALAGIVGIPLLINGLGMLAGGIPMIVIGNRKIPAELPGMPHVVGAPGGAGLAFDF